MKKSNITMALITILTAASCAMAGSPAIGTLSDTKEKLSSLDMKKDSGMAVGMLNSFFTGAKTIKGNPLPVRGVTNMKKAGQASLSEKAAPARNIYGQTAEEICNAKPAAKRKLASAVKPLPTVQKPHQKGLLSFFDSESGKAGEIPQTREGGSMGDVVDAVLTAGGNEWQPTASTDCGTLGSPAPCVDVNLTSVPR